MTWVVVPNWERFQHYGNTRHPIWIKNYTALLHKPEYRNLNLTERGLLHGIWLAYADSHRLLKKRDVRHQLHTVHSLTRQWDPLLEAGFIEFVASNTLILRSTDVDARPREETHQKHTAARRRRAESWIRNGAALEVPAAELAGVFRDEFKIDDPGLLETLVAQAQELRSR